MFLKGRYQNKNGFGICTERYCTYYSSIEKTISFSTFLYVRVCLLLRNTLPVTSLFQEMAGII